MTRSGCWAEKRRVATKLLELREIVKSFHPVRALDRVAFDVSAGEIHALCGENGAGKSTLIKILCGIWPHGSYEGQILLDGRECRFRDPRAATRHGISVIHQELSLVAEMTVAENVFLGREPSQRGWIDRARMRDATRRLLAELRVALDPDDRVGSLGMGEQQMVEIAKAFSQEFRVLVLDEPTSSLSGSEAERLLQTLLRLRDRGTAIVYVSHRLNEVLRVSKRITVLRDGKSVGTAPTDGMTEARLINQMVGRELSGVFPRRRRTRGAPRLRVENLSVADARRPGRRCVDRVSLTAHAGEILGIGGLLGAGRTELLEALFGVGRSEREGRVWVNEVAICAKSPRDAIRQGIAFVTEDRKGSGLVPDQGVGFNTTLATLKQFCSLQWIDSGRTAQAARECSQRLNIKAASLDAPVNTLSGGNQQRVVLAKWLLTEPRVILLDEPTRGIDVGARAEIYGLIHDLADRGLAVVLVSSDLPELLGLADRILVLSDGKCAGEFEAGRATQAEVMKAMTSAFAQDAEDRELEIGSEK